MKGLILLIHLIMTKIELTQQMNQIVYLDEVFADN